MKKLIKTFLKMLLFVVIVIFPFLTIAIVGCLTKPQYSETYLAGLSLKYNRLNSLEEKKIIIIGGSATAFGVRSDLIEKEISDYKCVNFGLYASIGTKAMMELSKSNINKEDIVILMPETSSQALSMYFNPETILQSLDANWSMIRYFDKSDKEKLMGNYFSFFLKKMDYLFGGNTINLSGVYQLKNINQYGDIEYLKRDKEGNKIVDDEGHFISMRSYNVMPGMVDNNQIIDYNKEILDSTFINYANDYASYVKSRGAKMMFAFSPSNSPAVQNTAEEIADYYWHLRNNLKMQFIGNPFEHIIDPEYFYDSNFHLNDSGAVLNTVKLIDDLKQVIGIDKKTEIEIPDKPIIPEDEGDEGEGPDTKDYYLYEDFLDYKNQKTGVSLVGVKDEYLSNESLSLPWYVDSYKLMCLKGDSLANTNNLKTIYINKTLKVIESKAFNHCKQLEKIVIPEGMEPDDCFVPYDIQTNKENSMLYGCNDNVKIMVPQDKLGEYEVHYNWSRYSNHLVGY